MIDHEVTIGGIDVSEEVLSIKVQDQIDSESDPGKITITLVNRPSKYSTIESWIPQTTPIKIILKNWVYRTEAERVMAGGHAEQIYLVAYGHMTDCSRSSSEIVVTGECDLGHLADAIGDEFNNKSLTGTSKEILEKVLYYHNPPPDAWYNARIIRYDKAKNYNSETTFQEVLEDIANDVGAVYYYSADGILQFRDPTSVGEFYDLDPYVINPDDTKSIMGYCNIVKVIGDETLADSEAGREAPGSNPLQHTAKDVESIAEFGELVAPTDRAVWIGNSVDCQKRAELLLNFFKLFKNALTKPKVAGIVPPLHSMVSYSVFIPIAEGEAVSGTITGTVVARSIDYSIEGLECELTVSRGVTDMTSYVGDEEIADAALTYGEED
jgi:hypothetical protein